MHVLLNFIELSEHSKLLPALFPTKQYSRVALAGRDMESIPIAEKYTSYAMQINLAETYQGLVGEVGCGPCSRLLRHRGCRRGGFALSMTF